MESSATPKHAAIGDPEAKALVFGTSAAVLVLEILAGRLMAPYVGVSLETFTGIIGTMLAGIAVGASVGGRLADRQDARALIGPALVVGGALTWLSLPILSLLGPLVASDPASIVVLAAFAFFAPSAVLSTVGPMVAKLRLSSLSQTGSVVGGLSAAGTAGAIFGTFVTGFVLVAALPSRPVVLALGAVLVAVGLFLWTRLGDTKPQTIGIVVLFGAFGLGAYESSPCEFETTYSCVAITIDPERASGRSLILDDVRNSYVDLEDPTYLEFRYIRLFADVVDAIGPTDPVDPTAPLDVLSLGGAGFTFPRYIEATRPGSNNLVLEIDEKLVQIAQDELGVELDDDLAVIIGDARLAFEDLESDDYDLVIGDAFSGRSVPWHLTTTEVVAEIERVLRPDGVYVMNVIDGGDSDYARAQLATLGKHFEHVRVILPANGIGNRSVNQVLVASNAELPVIMVDTTDGFLLNATHTEAYIDGARILRDDFAPVDQLTS
jgi:SAM-dependent methyltransferase